MKKETPPPEGTIPKSREIYFLILMGHIYYWLNWTKNKALKTMAPGNKKTDANFQVKVFNDIAGGQIRDNQELIKHLPSNPLNEKIIESAIEGIPLVTIGQGSFPRVMITAGLHGNELAPQIASINLINELQRNKIRGTVYIFPFVAPEASAANNKLFQGDNLNLSSNIPGNPSNLVFETVKSMEITALADFHTTSTDPAKTCVIYYPTVKSSKIAVYIHKKVDSPLLALKQHPGMLITQCNLHGTPSVICEVEAPDGAATEKSIKESYQQMKAFLGYSGVID